MLSLKGTSQEILTKAFQSRRNTEITTAKTNFTINQGKLANNDLSIAIPFANFTGKGVLDLTTLETNYRLLPTVSSTAIDLTVPIIFEGSIFDPVIKPDADFVIQQQLQKIEKVNEFKEKLQKQLEKVNPALLGGLGIPFDLINKKKTVTGKPDPEPVQPPATPAQPNTPDIEPAPPTQP